MWKSDYASSKLRYTVPVNRAEFRAEGEKSAKPSVTKTNNLVTGIIAIALAIRLESPCQASREFVTPAWDSLFSSAITRGTWNHAVNYSCGSREHTRKIHHRMSTSDVAAARRNFGIFQTSAHISLSNLRPCSVFVNKNFAGLSSAKVILPCRDRSNDRCFNLSKNSAFLFV